MYHFIHIPKTSGVTLDKLIQANPSCNLKYCGHVKASEIQLLTFVRNPYDRIVSAYFYLCADKDNLTGHLEKISKYASFKDFVMNMEKDGLLNVVLHLIPMWSWVTDEHGKLLAKVFKIEEPNSINVFLAENGIGNRAESPKHNNSIHDDYMSYMDEEIIAEINRIYYLDFELFNYQKL